MSLWICDGDVVLCSCRISADAVFLPAVRSHLITSVAFFFFKQKTAYYMRISDWSSDVCSSDLKESHAKGALDRRIYKVMRGSWANHYRRMLPSLLSVLEFRSNNAVWRPVLAALDWIRSKVDGGCRFVPLQDV